MHILQCSLKSILPKLQPEQTKVLASPPAFVQTVPSALLMPPSFHLLANPGHPLHFHFDPTSPWMPSVTIPDWHRHPSSVFLELLGLNMVYYMPLEL